MGLRHAGHRFMPGVLVFPGGRVDRADHRAPAEGELRPATRAALERRATPSLARALAIAAARELQEETGLALGRVEGGRLRPTLGVLDYLCRAVTPADRAIRFNARFLVAPAEAAEGALAGSGELEGLGFVGLDAAAPMAGITAKVLGEFGAWLEMTPAAREARRLICFQGPDQPRAER